MNNTGLHDLGVLTMLRTYSKAGEDWNSIVNRYLQFMIGEYPHMEKSIKRYGNAIIHKFCVPSMRALQFAGEALKKEHLRAYNCSFVAPETFKDFSDVSYLLCCGCGVGFSVEDVSKIPPVGKGFEQTVVLEDTKEAWADSWAMLLNNPNISFDYSLIRPSGTPLSSGGTASGALPLSKSHEAIRSLIKQGEHLRTVDVADIICHIANAIVGGGVRRSATICLYKQDDTLMHGFKAGNWFKDNLHRAKANISAVAVKYGENVMEVIQQAIYSEWGEPGLVLKSNANSLNPGINPCSEISLRSRGLCNLSEVIACNCIDIDGFIYACEAASFFGTLQAGLTKFNYVHSDWAEHAKEDALLGVSITGTAMARHLLTPETLQAGAKAVKEMNKECSKRIAINPAKRLTAIKPSGTTSCVMGTTSGIHAAHGEYVIRRIRLSTQTPLGSQLVRLYGMGETKYNFIQQDNYNATDIVLQFPCHYRDAIYRKDEDAIDLLKRMRELYHNWILPGHVEGDETNNVSITVSVPKKRSKKRRLKKWMKNNQHCYRGISLLPYDGGSYVLAPFEEVTYKEWLKYLKEYPKLDWSDFGISANIQETSACSGGQCEII